MNCSKQHVWHSEVHHLSINSLLISRQLSILTRCAAMLNLRGYCFILLLRCWVSGFNWNIVPIPMPAVPIRTTTTTNASPSNDSTPTQPMPPTTTGTAANNGAVSTTPPIISANTGPPPGYSGNPAIARPLPIALSNGTEGMGVEGAMVDPTTTTTEQSTTHHPDYPFMVRLL